MGDGETILAEFGDIVTHAPMKARARVLALIVVGCTAVSPSVLAHHAVQKVFDVTKPITVTGTLTEVEWLNPHSYITVEAKDAKGAVQQWIFELPGPAALRATGISVENHALKPGDLVTVDALAAKDGTPTGFVSTLHLRDGRTFDLTKRASHAQ